MPRLIDGPSPQPDLAPATPAVYAARAARAYRAMRDGFRHRKVLYRRDGLLHLPGTAAHLWPFSRAFVATLDLAGMGGDSVAGLDAEVAIAEHLEALERYWDPLSDAPAYASDVLGSRRGGDRYYDDNAWVGLALVQLERMRPGSGHVARAQELYRFALGGWDRRDLPDSGGVFWVEQGGGAGLRNHDRNTVSNAPNAELGLHLAELTGDSVTAPGQIGADAMYEWVVAVLDAGRGSDSAATGLFWDKLRGDGTLDRTLWSYNQGSMVGANVMLARRGASSQSNYLARAEAIARKALLHYAGDGYDRQPPAFNAIFFRNLLLLHAATSDRELRHEILQAMRSYADRAWTQRRDRHDRFHFSKRGTTLLDQSAMVQLLSLLAWDPASYEKLA